MYDCDAIKEISEHPDGPSGAWAQCRFCQEWAWIEDPEEDFGSSPCAACQQVEDYRSSVFAGHVEHWIDRRCGRWFVWICHRCAGYDMMLCRIEAPAPAGNIYFDDDGGLRGPRRWEETTTGTSSLT